MRAYISVLERNRLRFEVLNYMEYILKGYEKIERSVVSQRRNNIMDVKRVKQILSSSSRIDVTYEGVQYGLRAVMSRRVVLKCMTYPTQERAFTWM